MTKPKIERIDIDRFDGTGDFLLWKVRMMAHFGVLGLKDILTDEKLLMDSPVTKEEGDDTLKDTEKKEAEAIPTIDPVKLGKSEKAKDLIVVNVGNQVLRKICNYAKAVVTPTSSQFKLRSLKPEQKEEERKHMEDVPYSSAVGSIMYAMVGSRPDLGFAVGLISRYMSEPGREHWAAAKWVLRYLTGATGRCLTFTKGSKFSIEGFCDSDYATDLDRRRSVTGYVFQIWGNTVSWRSGLQDVVALSTTEADTAGNFVIDSPRTRRSNKVRANKLLLIDNKEAQWLQGSYLLGRCEARSSKTRRFSAQGGVAEKRPKH
ncbi:hypothetical protein YC2023_073988 [Brassica napus]